MICLFSVTCGDHGRDAQDFCFCFCCVCGLRLTLFLDMRQTTSTPLSLSLDYWSDVKKMRVLGSQIPQSDSLHPGLGESGGRISFMGQAVFAFPINSDF